MELGTVTSISAEGFGFIAADRHSGEIWMRPRSTEDDRPLYVGQRVEYVVAIGPLGIEAADVRPLGL